MYKKVLKNIKDDMQKKEDFFADIFKAEGNHGIRDKKPHFIFSAENPYHPTKLKMSHEEAIDFLRDKGYNVESMDGKYGSEERSILVNNPSKNAFKHLNKLAAAMGQDSAIMSDGYNHEMVYLNGPKAGKHHKGQGTVFHEKEPADFYSTLDDGTHFTHGFDFDNLYNDSKFIKNTAGSIKKSENLIKNGQFIMRKAEDGPQHPLARAGAGTKLIHYSPEQGLVDLDPEHHGVRKIGAEAKHGAPKHRMTFYYTEGTEPESIVTTGAKSKYVVDLGNKKLYDIGKDPHGLYSQAKEKAQAEKDAYTKSKGWVGKTMASAEDVQNAYHQAIKDAGFHGIYNSGAGSMSNVVGMFHAMTPEAEYKLHPEDFKKTSSKNYYTEDAERDRAEQWASENGHYSPRFLHNLRNKFEE